MTFYIGIYVNENVSKETGMIVGVSDMTNINNVAIDILI